MKLILSAILLFLTHAIFPQNKLPDSTNKFPFDINKIKEARRLSGTSDEFSYDSIYIWNDKRSLSEIMNERAGYFINDFGLGGRNDINFNNGQSYDVGIYRDGIQLNDRLRGNFDIQNISINEIDKIEEISNVASFFYGINSSAKAVNVITKDIFQPKPFSQLRFSQDRFASLFADVFLSQPLSRKFNLQLGLTKHSLDGRYKNSNFNIWRGRGRLNFFLSPKFNAKINFYLNNYDRGLNDGLVYSANNNLLTDPTLATVIHPNTNEHLENYYYDATITARLLRNQTSLTKLILYSNNSYRKLNNGDDSVLSVTNLPSGYFHTILYGADLTQNLNIINTRTIQSNVLLGADLYLNYFNSDLFKPQSAFIKNYYSLRSKFDFLYKLFSVTALIRNDNIDSRNFLNLGLEGSFKLFSDKTMALIIHGGVNRIKYKMNEFPNKVYEDKESATIIDTPINLFEAGINFSYKNFSSDFLAYRNHHDSPNKGYNGGNATISYIDNHFDFTAILNYAEYTTFPKYYLKSGIAYKDVLFNKKLKIKTGITLKYYQINYITKQFQTLYVSDDTSEPFPQKNQFIADFYVGARIGHANINLTVANIFNSLVYNSYLFPLDDRGGFLNSISRFTIVWDFIN